MTTTLVENIAVLATGEPGAPVLRDTTLVVDGAAIAAIGEVPPNPDFVVDAAGLTVIPGLVDGHVHPSFGEWTPAQDSLNWISNYAQGGTTTMVSAGELHLPGMPFDELTADDVVALARTSRRTTARVRPSGVRVHAGTVLLVPGMRQSHFDQLAEAGVHQAKFIFYDWSRLGDGEAQQYVAWARERGITVKIHSGGVSRSGSSRIAGHEVVAAVGADVVAHISGGPIPMPDEEIRAVIDDRPECAVEVCASMNHRATIVTTDHLKATGGIDRLTLGTDTPGGTGVIPRGMLRNIAYLAGVCGVDAAEAVACGTGVTAARHGLDVGVLAPGRPADFVLIGPIRGSRATDGLESLALGDLPGVSSVFIDGRPLFLGRSSQTPPPHTPARLTHGNLADLLR
ncbi:amidohydrolase family protein [Amycolatopsis taiwanensis]|uniref:Adenine deaminase n=1 Tax=Amycolatopsis taiwanensis TaxID=342230 RepID=A0A9W6R608_9PSEU|nr:amidohydrolase family protein [Amycolatopsis taiwanensis]GLY68110.1 adenine deaminase [Amycolatopsis taiwanensis]